MLLIMIYILERSRLYLGLLLSVGEGDRMRTCSGFIDDVVVSSDATADDINDDVGGFFFRIPPVEEASIAAEDGSLCFRMGIGLKTFVAAADEYVESKSPTSVLRSSELFLRIGLGCKMEWKPESSPCCDAKADGGIEDIGIGDLGGDRLSKRVSDDDLFLTLGTGGACITVGPLTTRARFKRDGEELTERLCCSANVFLSESLGLGTGKGVC
jgi:hypothetical protein